jgi:hypothetical protein
MRYTLILLACIIMQLSAKGQITLDHTFDAATYFSRPVLFSSNGTKIMVVDTSFKTVRFYTTSYLLWKIITLHPPAGYQLQYLWLPSDNLFNADDNIELVVNYYNPSWPSSTVTQVVNESGHVIFDLGDANDVSVHVIDGAYKLFTYNYPSTLGVLPVMKVYSLPGSLPCGDCNSLGAVKITRQQSTASISAAVPNPSNGEMKIFYQLPPDARSGKVVFYNSAGQTIQSVNVSAADKFLLFDNSKLPAGLYRYVLSGDNFLPVSNGFIK